MNMLKAHKKELLFAVPILVVFALLLLLETQLPFFTRFMPVGENKVLIVLLNINVLLILLLLFLVARILIKSYIEQKRGIWGSGLKTKLTLTLLLISIVPSFTLFILTTGFFYRSIDNWFSQKVEDTMDDAIEISRFYYEELFQRYEETAKILGRHIQNRQLLANPGDLAAYLKKTATWGPPGYVRVFDTGGNLIGSAGKIDKDSEKKLAQLVKGFSRHESARVIVALESGELIGWGVRITGESKIPAAVVFAGNVTKFKGLKKIQVIAGSYKEFKESRPFRKILKYSFVIPLSLVTIITIFFSVWVGLKFATEITVAVEKVKEGVSIIAKGNFDINLEDRGRDEINTLVQAFNSMARELQVAKNEIEEKKRYLEVILNNVGTGIISTDKNGTILLINNAAQNILCLDQDQTEGASLKEIFGEEFKMHMRPFLKEAKEASDGSVIREMKLRLNRNITYLRTSLTILKDKESRTDGFIITFDDITHLVRAEKLATWREVARKLAHEIKNPLTPILLSAERIRRKLLPRTADTTRDVLDETTSVIIHSVEDIRHIVNELTQFTHMAQTKAVEDINAIAEEALNLYRNLYQNIAFSLEKTAIPALRADRDGIKRALTNLITNAVKAIGDEPGSITVRTDFDSRKGAVKIEISDTGIGISDEDKEKIFDPYFTTAKDGMGLGLAIVHSIILEHQGKIVVEDNLPRGTRFIIELPFFEEEA
jgi:two-component system nitrogen regulation sensor histidine kinase NtrY